MEIDAQAPSMESNFCFYRLVYPDSTGSTVLYSNFHGTINSTMQCLGALGKGGGTKFALRQLPAVTVTVMVTLPRGL